MKWIITTDHISERICITLNEPVRTHINKLRADKTLVLQLREATPQGKAALIEEFKAGMTDEFRLFDDDGELYYEGLCLNLDEQDGESAFEPLDWARYDSGCTRMDYRKRGEGEWKTL